MSGSPLWPNGRCEVCGSGLSNSCETCRPTTDEEQEAYANSRHDGALVEICDGEAVVSCDPNLTVVVVDWIKLGDVEHYQPEDYTALIDQINALPAGVVKDRLAGDEVIELLDGLRATCARWHGTAR